MATITTKDGTQILYKDWGPKDAQPIVFHHRWPLSSDDWDTQMLYFLANGYRVVAHDRRGHGRSSQVGTGHDIDHYASDASAVAEHLDLKNAIHVGHSTGGGEVTRYVAKYGEPQRRVSKAVLISARWRGRSSEMVLVTSAHSTSRETDPTIDRLFVGSILGTLRGRYQMPSGIILYQTTSADTV